MFKRFKSYTTILIALITFVLTLTVSTQVYGQTEATTSELTAALADSDPTPALTTQAENIYQAAVLAAKTRITIPNTTNPILSPAVTGG